MLLKNATFLDERFEKKKADIYVKNGVFEKIGENIEADDEIVLLQML